MLDYIVALVTCISLFIMLVICVLLKLKYLLIVAYLIYTTAAYRFYYLLL